MNLKTSSKGFTLIELLSVIAIIGLLIAILIPMFANQTKKARRTTCMANLKSLETELSAEYITNQSKFKENYSCTIEPTGDYAEYTCPEHGTIQYILNDGRFTVSCSVHSVLIYDRIISTLSEQFMKNNTKQIDSTATNNYNTLLLEVQATLKEEGLDLNAIEATSWKIAESGDNRMFEWTSSDISTMNAGDEIIVMRYKEKYGYSVWKAKVALKNDYNVISQNGYPSKDITKNLLPKEKRDFNLVKKIYDEETRKNKA